MAEDEDAWHLLHQDKSLGLLCVTAFTWLVKTSDPLVPPVVHGTFAWAESTMFSLCIMYEPLLKYQPAVKRTGLSHPKASCDPHPLSIGFGNQEH